MQKRSLGWIVVIILVAVSFYQFFSEDASSSEPQTPEPAPVTVVIVEGTDTPEPVTETPETKIPVTMEPPTATPTDTISLPEPTGEFDFFVLALSWSPDYCASNGSNDPQQCSIGKKLDFVLHGLWPQYDRGYPSYCSTETMPEDLKGKFPGLYPNDALYDHEWKKHGTCTGLTPEGYMFWSQELKESVLIPAEFDSPEEPFRINSDGLKEAFVQVNPIFHPDSIEVFCSGSGRFLKEIFVCFSKQGKPTGCGPELQKGASKSCGQPDFLVRNTR